MCFLLISTEFLTASAGVGSWYGNAKPTPCGSGELAVISGVLALFRVPEPARPKNRYARFWRAAYLRMSDYELREAAFRGGVRETLAEIGADFARMIACAFDLDC